MIEKAHTRATRRARESQQNGNIYWIQSSDSEIRDLLTHSRSNWNRNRRRERSCSSYYSNSNSMAEEGNTTTANSRQAENWLVKEVKVNLNCNLTPWFSQNVLNWVLKLIFLLHVGCGRTLSALENLFIIFNSFLYLSKLLLFLVFFSAISWCFFFLLRYQAKHNLRSNGSDNFNGLVLGTWTRRIVSTFCAKK